MVGESFCFAIVNSAPLLPYANAPLVMLNESVTVRELLKTKLWLMPKAGSLGHVLFIGLQSVKVCASTEVVVKRATAPKSVEKCMVADDDKNKNRVSQGEKVKEWMHVVCAVVNGDQSDVQK